MSTMAISTILFSLDAPVMLKSEADSDLQSSSRRVSRTATLDGGCVITDSGFSHGDRTMRVKALIDQETGERITSMHQSYSLLLFSVPEGVFIGAIESISIQETELSLTILIKEKL